LKRDPQIEIIAECGSGIEALDKIRAEQPDLLFLDVQMPECDGFDVLEMLGRELPPAVVFVTAYDHYALRAFEAGALDYLLKPFDNARFEIALTRAKEKLARSNARPHTIDRLAIKSTGQVAFVNVTDIDWIEAADYYACLHVGQHTHLLRRSLQELEDDLDQSAFCRIHRSAIVNLDRVRTLVLGSDGEYQVLLSSGASLRLSRRYRKLLQERMGVRETNEAH
jgi:two-component system LytT family response regulator